MKLARTLTSIAVVAMVIAGGRADAALTVNGSKLNGTATNGIKLQGRSLQGRSLQGRSLQGRSLQGKKVNGTRVQGRKISGDDHPASPVAKSEAGVFDIDSLKIQSIAFPAAN